MFESERLFRDVVQQASVSRAAKLNKISQSAASQQIFELERQLRIQLLDRTTRPINPTPAGKLYFEFCRDILRREEEFVASLESLQSRTEGRVRIASIYSVGVLDVPWHCEQFRKRFPRVELLLSLGRPDMIYSAILEDQADLGMMSYPDPGREFTVVPWRDEPMSVVVPSGHPLSGFTSISASQLEGQPFIAFDEDLPIRRDIDRYLRESGVSVNITFSVDNIETLKTCVASGSGISILPHCVDDRLISLKLNDPLVRPVGIIYRRGKVLNRAAQLFIDQLAENPGPPQSSSDLSTQRTVRLSEEAETVGVLG